MPISVDRKPQVLQFKLEKLGPGVWGRTIPKEELVLNKDLVVKLAQSTGSEAFASFIYGIYKISSTEVAEISAKMAAKSTPIK